MKRHTMFPALLSLTIASIAPARALAQALPATDAAHRTTSTIAAANRAATIEPSPPAFVNASAVMPYAEGAIYQVYTTPERVTDIALEAGEVLGAVASGDTARWVIGDTTSGAGAGKRVHMRVKP